MTGFAETFQLVLAWITLPFALRFVWRFAHPSERWYKTMFGWSLMTLAVAVVLQMIQAILFRLFGADYWGRPVILIVAASLTFVAMVLRDHVLGKAQRDDRARARAHTEHL